MQKTQIQETGLVEIAVAEEKRESNLARVQRRTDWYLRCLQPKLLIANMIAGFVPRFDGWEVRARAYRWAGCNIGEGTQILGPIDFYGTDPQLAEHLTIRDGVNIGPKVTLGLDGEIFLGRNVAVGPGSWIYTTTHG